MFKNLFLIFFIIIVFFLGDRIFTSFGIYLTKYSSLPEAKLYNGSLESSIIIIGNSRAYRHFYEDDWSKALNKSVKNISKPGAPLVHLETFLNDYSKIYKYPEKIIIELDCLLTDTDIISSYKFMTHLSKNYSSTLKRFDVTGFYFSKFFNLYKLNSNIYLNMIHKIFKEYEQPKLYGEIDESQISNFKNAKKETRFISKSFNLQSLLSIMRNFEGKSDLILVISPFHPQVIKKYEKDIEKWINDIKNKTDEKIPIFDYSKTITENVFFNDLYHLNNNGVIEMNKILIDDLFFEKI